MSQVIDDLCILYEQAKGSRFIMETGGGHPDVNNNRFNNKTKDLAKMLKYLRYDSSFEIAKKFETIDRAMDTCRKALQKATLFSTYYLAKAAKESRGIMYSIELDENKVHQVFEETHAVGWSITHDDLIKPGHPMFVHTECGDYTDDDRYVVDNSISMKGPVDLIRKIIRLVGSAPDFFFCDTGEYCGLAEWNIVKDLIPVGGKFACHDIYYPKSIKCFQIVTQIVTQIEASDQWEVLDKTQSSQGLLVAKKVY